MRNLWMALALLGSLAGGQALAQQSNQMLDGVSIAKLSAILDEVKERHGLEVSERRSTSGTPYLFLNVPGTTLSFIATGIGCRSSTGRCEGFMYVMGDPGFRASDDLVLNFNNSAFYAKILPLPDVTVLRMELVADGGISEALIDRSLRTFAARINTYRSLRGDVEEPENGLDSLVPQADSFVSIARIFPDAALAPRAEVGWGTPSQSPSILAWTPDESMVDQWASE